MSDTTGSGRNRELVLPPGTYAYVLDTTKGKVSVYVGPIKNSLSDTDQLVKWDADQKRYVPSGDVEKSVQVWTEAQEGQYIVLNNPSQADGGFPNPGQANDAVTLDVGKRVIIPGPVNFPLWPGQTAKAIEGHHLRHNQYVLVRVYDQDQARENWESAIMAPQTNADDENTAVIEDTDIDASRFTMGQLIIVPGTRVSFYMPSTGVEVVREEGGDTGVSIGAGNYVRDAVTLETLEYCVLLDENGQKRYVHGPAVVFPRPTEAFRKNKLGGRNFQAIELDERSGLYVKVIEAYTEDGETHPVGEELFITGKEQAIYFPRAEHSIISYGDQKKHHAIAIPAGEGRYVLNRRTGQVELQRGPSMFLPDPRYQVVVRRILDPHDVALMYPGNEEALAVNQRYQQESEAQEAFAESKVAHALPDPGLMRSTRALYSNTMSVASASAMPESLGHAGGAVLDSFSATQNFGGDAMSRGTSYTPARTITLDTKYEGAVAINIWPGYAVLVTNKTGDRRVEVGPQTVLLEYDETIMALELSTGRPKTDTKVLRTGYLRVLNNVVSDLITVETRDLVTVNVGVSYRVNFESADSNDEERWFALENYVQVLTDHARSRLRNTAKQHDIRTFYSDAINIVRDSLLGERHEGLLFNENGMLVYDVEVLNVAIQNQGIEALLLDAQNRALKGTIELQVAQDQAERQTELEELTRRRQNEQFETWSLTQGFDLAKITSQTQVSLAAEESALVIAREHAKVVDKELALEWSRYEAQLRQLTAEDNLSLERLAFETGEYVRRLAAISPEFITALQAFGDKALVEKITSAVAPAAFAAGVTTADLMANIFKGTPLEPAMEALTARPLNGARPQPIDA